MKITNRSPELRINDRLFSISRSEHGVCNYYVCYQSPGSETWFVESTHADLKSAQASLLALSKKCIKKMKVLKAG